MLQVSGFGYRLRQFAAATGAAAAFLMLAIATAAAQVAPGTRTDDFGNTISGSPINKHIPSNLFWDIVPTNALKVAFKLNEGNDVIERGVPLGFLFPFYGKTYSALSFSTNGYISTDTTSSGSSGFDPSNDPDLPTPGAGGSGGRIYPYHDDLEAHMYGRYFSAATSPYGTEAFIAQWDACHYIYTTCSYLDIYKDPDEGGLASEDLIQFSTTLLRDGTIIMAYNFAGWHKGGPFENELFHSSGAGSYVYTDDGATIGIQNPETGDTTNTDDDDGIAYSANWLNSIIDGMTVLIIPAKSGISDDIQIAATETSIVTTSAFAGNVHNHAARALRHKQPGRKRHIWGSIIAGRADGDVGSDIEIKDYGVQFGADLMKFGDAIIGISASYQKADAALGHVGLVSKSGSVAPYAGISFGHLTATATVGYARVDYEDFDLVFLRGIETDSGHRFFGSASLIGNYSFGLVTLQPNLTATGALEKLDSWHAGVIRRDVENARFFKLSATAKAIYHIAPGTQAYMLGGVQFIKTDGDDTIALYATDYDETRNGIIVGGGLEMKVGGFDLTAEAKASGIGSDITSVDGQLRASVKF